MLALKFARCLSGSVLFRRKRGRDQATAPAIANDRNNLAAAPLILSALPSSSAPVGRRSRGNARRRLRWSRECEPSERGEPIAWRQWC